jgi:glycosyltransferase involved in cell wall biosynthesis
MRIGIDVSQVVFGTGVSFYTRKLVENLLKIDRKNQYVLFGGSLRRKKDLRRFAQELSGNFSTKFLPLTPSLADIVWNRLYWGKIEWFLGQVDIFHSSDWAQPPTEAFTVTTVHDLSTFKYPKLAHPKVLKTHKRRLSRVIDNVDRIIVPSQATKADLLELEVEEKRIRVIAEAPGEEFMPAKKSQIKKVKKEYKVSGGYLLAVGTNPRKNLERIVKAYEQVRAGKDLKLLVVGRKEGKLELDRGIRYTGHVDDKELATLYSGAKALVYPSLSEGFGLPILQAFACECPVVTSDVSSMPEVAGKGAVLVDPENLNSIVEGIETAVRRKKSLVKKGKEEVAKYSWKKTAEETLKVYLEAKK